MLHPLHMCNLPSKLLTPPLSHHRRQTLSSHGAARLWALPPHGQGPQPHHRPGQGHGQGHGQSAAASCCRQWRRSSQEEEKAAGMGRGTRWTSSGKRKGRTRRHAPAGKRSRG